MLIFPENWCCGSGSVLQIQNDISDYPKPTFPVVADPDTDPSLQTRPTTTSNWQIFSEHHGTAARCLQHCKIFLLSLCQRQIGHFEEKFTNIIQILYKKKVRSRIRYNYFWHRSDLAKKITDTTGSGTTARIHPFFPDPVLTVVYYDQICNN